MSFISAFRKVGDWVYKHSSEILTVVGVGGTIYTAIDAYKAGKKAAYALDRVAAKKAAENEEYTTVDRVKTVAPYMMNTAMDVVITVSAIVLLYNVDAKKQANLASALTAMTAKYENFKSKTKTRVGEETFNEIERDIMLDYYNGEKVFNTTINKGKRKLFWEPITEQFFTSSEEDITLEALEINRMLVVNGEISVNEYLMYLGLPEVDWGWNVGWSDYVGPRDYGYKWIDIFTEEFEVKTDSDYYDTVYKLVVPFEPHEDFMDM